MFVGVVLIILGGATTALLTLIRAKGAQPHLPAVTDGVVAEGTVQKIVTDDRAIIAFTDTDGNRVGYKERSKAAEKVQVGAYLPVLYDPADPAGTATILPKGYYQRQPWENTRAVLLSGGVFLAGLLIVAGVIPL